MRVLSVGEILWDCLEKNEFLGGAPLNVCANLRRCQDDPLLLSAVGADPRGNAALDAMQRLGLATELVQTIAAHPTGTATVDHDAAGEPVFTIQRPAAFDAMELRPATLQRVAEFAPDWIYIGTLLQVEPAMESLVAGLVAQLPKTRCFYDMNLRPGNWNLPLVERLCSAASLLKLNEVEAATLAGLTGIGGSGFSLEGFCAGWAQRFELDLICVTLGPAGCCVYANGKSDRFPGYSVKVSDTVGAGDAFAAAFLHGYHRDWPIARCAAFANALGALVASRPGATPAWTMDECISLAASSPAA